MKRIILLLGPWVLVFAASAGFAQIHTSMAQASHRCTPSPKQRCSTIGFLYNKRVFRTIEYPGASYTRGSGINTSGEVLGIYFDDSGQHTFTYSRGVFTHVDALDALDGHGRYNPFHMNDADQIVGYFNDYPDFSGLNHGFFYSEGVISTINYPLAKDTFAYGINNVGQLVGAYTMLLSGTDRYYGFLYNEGVFSSIDYPGATYTEASGISDGGEIVGTYFDSSYLAHGYAYNAGSFTSLDFPGAFQTFASGINDLGQIVGSYDDGSGRSRGFLYSGGTFTKIDYHGPNSPVWYKDTVPMDINSNGQIVGQEDRFKVKHVH